MSTNSLFTELLGIVASSIILVSMLFKTSTYKGTIYMRIINACGSAIFIVYGFLLPAYATAFLNCTTLLVNVVYLYIEYKGKKSNENLSDSSK